MYQASHNADEEPGYSKAHVLPITTLPASHEQNKKILHLDSLRIQILGIFAFFFLTTIFQIC
jgi:hypothetical protein